MIGADTQQVRADQVAAVMLPRRPYLSISLATAAFASRPRAKRSPAHAGLEASEGVAAGWRPSKPRVSQPTALI
jgi:hypothetical protein